MHSSIRIQFPFRTIFILIFPLIFILILPSIIPCSVFSNQLFSFFLEWCIDTLQKTRG